MSETFKHVLKYSRESMIAAEALTKYHFVSLAHGVPAADGDPIIGAIDEDYESGEQYAAVMVGTAMVVVGDSGTIDFGDLVMTDDAGEAIEHTTGQAIAGMSLTKGTVNAGGIIEVLLAGPGSAAAP